MWYVVDGMIVMPPLIVFVHGFVQGFREGSELQARSRPRFRVVWPDCEEGNSKRRF